MKPPRTVAALAVGVVFVTGLVGCSGGSNKSAVCSDMDSLQKTVQSLTHEPFQSGSVSKIQNDLATLREQWDTFKKDAKSQFSGDVNKVQSSIDELSTTVAAAKADPSASTLSAAATAAKGVGDATKGLATAVSGTC